MLDATNIIDLVDRSLAALGKRVRIVQCGNHWHPVLIKIDSGELDQ